MSGPTNGGRCKVPTGATRTARDLPSSVATIIRWFRYHGTMHRPIARGPGSVCPPKPSGNSPRAAPTAAAMPRAETPRARPDRSRRAWRITGPTTTVPRTPLTVTAKRRRSAPVPPAARPSVSMTWPAMSGNGRPVVFPANRHGTSSRVAVGATIHTACARPISTATRPISDSTWWGSGVWTLVPKPRQFAAPPAAILAEGRNPCRRSGPAEGVRSPPRQSWRRCRCIAQAAGQ